MWPYKLMPDPNGAKRLVSIGCKIRFAKSKIKVPVEVKDYDDFVPGTRYPKKKSKAIWFVEITIPKELMNDIKEGSIDLADQTIDLEELDNSYEEDLDQEGIDQDTEGQPGTEPPGMENQSAAIPPPVA